MFVLIEKGTQFFENYRIAMFQNDVLVFMRQWRAMQTDISERNCFLCVAVRLCHYRRSKPAAQMYSNTIGLLRDSATIAHTVERLFLKQFPNWRHNFCYFSVILSLTLTMFFSRRCVKNVVQKEIINRMRNMLLCLEQTSMIKCCFHVVVRRCCVS